MSCHTAQETENRDNVARSPSTSGSAAIDRKHLPNYAKDTLKEVLGWYGLQEGSVGAGKEEDGIDKSSSAGLHPSAADDAVSSSSCESVSPDEDNEASPKQDVACSSPKSSSAVSRAQSPEIPLDLTGIAGIHTSSTETTGLPTPHGSRRLVGMRFLFPPLPEEMSLLDKARIWVARHEHKYFVGWTTEQLEYVDPLLRPISVISPAAYKLNMNRSEYCRNVKLKYCLESDAAWAQEFRLKLSKPPSEGGFTGLCQAKIAAAELWRKYSENYRSHQARYPNPKSKYKSRWMSHKVSEGGVLSLGKREVVDDKDGEDEKKRRLDDEKHELRSEERDDIMRQDSKSSEENSVPSLSARKTGALDSLPGCDGKGKSQSWTNENQPQLKSLWKQSEFSSASGKLTNGSSASEAASYNVDSSQQEGKLSRSQTASFDNLPHAACYPGLFYYNMALPLYQRSLQQMSSVPSLTSLHSTSASCIPDNSPRTSSPTLSETQSCSKSTPSPSASVGSAKCAPLSERQSEYKRSERGLSYLFPSLSDHNLSLIDKVHITVLRHKNNYFLGWTDEELTKVDPVVRPKMLVTQEIYKEYCHRNAMKYDSNLQFAMESQEAWAKDFHAKLLKPPSEGGFSSLCEVKLEAGRLWREYSGKYRMHNIVKWQMDLNTSASAPYASVAVKQETNDETSTVGASAGTSVPSSPLPRASETADFNISTQLKLEPHQSQSRASVVPNGGQSLLSELPSNPVRSDCIADNYPQSLFVPLSQDLSAADQLFIWLERHRNNYYLGFSEQDLSSLNPYLRPRCVVSQETFNRCIPASMVDVLNKIELMMSSGQSWAQQFRERLSKPRNDGGFSSFEEALTEAVVSWHANNRSDGAEMLSSTEGSLAKSARASLQHDVLYNNWLSQQQQFTQQARSHGHHKPENVRSENTRLENIRQEAVTRSTRNEDPVVVNGGGSRHVSSGSTREDPLVSLSCSDLSVDLWHARESLMEASKDDPQRSWCERLKAYLPVLRQHVGRDYELPSTDNACIVDLVLSLLQSEIDSKLKQS